MERRADMKAGPLLAQLGNQFVGINIITKPVDFGMVFLRRNVGVLDVNPGHNAAFADDLGRVEAPAARMAAQIQHPLLALEEFVLALRLFQFIH